MTSVYITTAFRHVTYFVPLMTQLLEVKTASLKNWPLGGGGGGHCGHSWPHEQRLLWNMVFSNVNPFGQTLRWLASQGLRQNHGPSARRRNGGVASSRELTRLCVQRSEGELSRGVRFFRCLSFQQLWSSDTAFATFVPTIAGIFIHNSVLAILTF